MIYKFTEDVFNKTLLYNRFKYETFCSWRHTDEYTIEYIVETTIRNINAHLNNNEADDYNHFIFIYNNNEDFKVMGFKEDAYLFNYLNKLDTLKAFI